MVTLAELMPGAIHEAPAVVNAADMWTKATTDGDSEALGTWFVTSLARCAGAGN